jgi:DNA-binding MarR family transcriptional regulator
MENKIQYTITINQLAIMRLGAEIDIIDAAIIDFIRQFIVSGKMKSKEIYVKMYFWMRASYITDQLPILGISEDWAKRRIVKLVKSGYMEMKLVDGNAPHVSLTEKGNSLFFGGVGENSEGGSEKTPTNHSTSDNNTESQKTSAASPRPKRSVNKVNKYETVEEIPGLSEQSENMRYLISILYKLGWKWPKLRDLGDTIKELKATLTVAGIMYYTTQGTEGFNQNLFKAEMAAFNSYWEQKNTGNALTSFHTWFKKMGTPKVWPKK